MYSVKSQWHFTGVLCGKQLTTVCCCNIRDIWQTSPLFMFGKHKVWHFDIHKSVCGRHYKMLKSRSSASRCLIDTQHHWCNMHLSSVTFKTQGLLNKYQCHSVHINDAFVGNMVLDHSKRHQKCLVSSIIVMFCRYWHNTGTTGVHTQSVFLRWIVQCHLSGFSFVIWWLWRSKSLHSRDSLEMWFLKSCRPLLDHLFPPSWFIFPASRAASAISSGGLLILPFN